MRNTELTRRAFIAGSTALSACATILPAASTRGSEVGFMSAAEMVQLFRARKLSPLEVVDALLQRSQSISPRFNAFYYYDVEGALSSARAAETRWIQGQPLSALDGVPVSVKDYIDVKGLPAPEGYGPVKRLQRLDERDALAVKNLRAGGLVIFAKSTAPEIGFLSAGVSNLYGPVRNPWAPELTSGGTSAGAAAAAAAGLGPFHLGSDSGSSNRSPASYCGVVGFKPSSFRVPRLNSDFRSVHGPLTRSVTDAALALDILAQAQAEDKNQRSQHQQRFADGLSSDSLRGKRIGVCHWVGDDAPKASDEVLSALDRSARIAEQAGARLVDVKPFIAPGLWRALGRAVIGQYGKEAPSKYSEEEFAALLPFHRNCIEICSRLTQAQLDDYQRQMISLIKQTPDPLIGLDLLLLPTMPGRAQRAEDPWPTYAEVDEVVGLAYNHLLYAAVFNLLQNPAISITAGISEDRLPIGIQVVGNVGDDAGVLNAAYALEQRLPAKGRPAI